jgi:hypothetical protein
MDNEHLIEDHIEKTLDAVRTIYKQTADIIATLKSGEKIATTELATQVAKNYGKTGPQMYPIILMVVNEFPGTTRKRGVKGGVWKL